MIPDALFEANERYELFLFTRIIGRNIVVTLMNSEALVTIVNDDSKSCHYICSFLLALLVLCVQSFLLMFTLFILCIYFTDVTVNLKSEVSAVLEGEHYVANVSVEPTTLLGRKTTFDVIVQTYTCGGYIAADCK